MNIFKDFWKAVNDSKLSAEELADIRQSIIDFKNGKLKFKELMSKLKSNSKLNENWKIQRVLRTEFNRHDSKEVVEDAKEEGIKKFKVIPSPGACEDCLRFSNYGKKIFKESEFLIIQIAIVH
jgi:galactokinase/mevalonate kinase-like predicted kinase